MEIAFSATNSPDGTRESINSGNVGVETAQHDAHWAERKDSLINSLPESVGVSLPVSLSIQLGILVLQRCPVPKRWGKSSVLATY